MWQPEKSQCQFRAQERHNKLKLIEYTEKCGSQNWLLPARGMAWGGAKTPLHRIDSTDDDGIVYASTIAKHAQPLGLVIYTSRLCANINFTHMRQTRGHRAKQRQTTKHGSNKTAQHCCFEFGCVFFGIFQFVSNWAYTLLHRQRSITTHPIPLRFAAELPGSFGAVTRPVLWVCGDEHLFEVNTIRSCNLRGRAFLTNFMSIRLLSHSSEKCLSCIVCTPGREGSNQQQNKYYERHRTR